MSKCPKCGKPFEVVAIATDYHIIGCPEHREFDKSTSINPPFFLPNFSF